MNETRYVQYSSGMVPARQPSPATSALKMGGVGMIVGAAGSAAANIRRLRNHEIDKGQALKNVLRDSAGAGAATAAATAVVGMLGFSGLMSVAGLLTTATAAKYLFDSAFEPAAEPAAAQKPSRPAKPAAAKKPTRKSTQTTKSAAKKED
jgi:hypothetical protein